jgi:hypothetical protein
VKETSRHGCSGQRSMDLTGSTTSCGRGCRRCRGTVCVHDRRVARVVVAVVVETLGPPVRLDGVRCVTVGPKTLLAADAAAPPPSPRSRCWEGGGFRPWVDGAPARPRSECWHEAELSACCAAAASSSAFSCWRTRRSSEVAASRQPHNSMATAVRFWDAHRKIGGASASLLVSTFAPSLARGYCCAPARVPAALVRDRAAGRQPNGARIGRRSPHRAPPVQECFA